MKPSLEIKQEPSLNMEHRLDKIEEKIDRLTDAMVSIARAEEKLAHFYDKLMYIAKNTSKSDEDSILLAGAMMAVSRILFYDHLNAKEAKDLINRGGYDLIELIKPTIH